MSKHERLQAEGLTVNALKHKYESEFKKRLAISNAQVKTKKCGGFVKIIQPVPTRNNIPFLINDKKVKTLNRYLESSEPEVKVNQAFLQHNTKSPAFSPLRKSRGATPAHDSASPKSKVSFD